ncbi:MAG: folylpolyglutamate synthase/dihydrofolate synthase family protein [Bacteroidota bacterium]
MTLTKDFQQTLDYLYHQLPMFQRQGASAFKKDLNNIKALCWELGLPQWQFPSIHVAGTNGKGSVTAMLHSILKEAGFKTGQYTSPHLLSFTERIQAKGKPISEKAVVDFVNKHKEMIERIQPSFFELTVAMGFQHFADLELDIAVVETGMGGRLDSTNILKPELCVITNIGYDHQQFLGDTLDKIAAEKAGIIKKYTPTVIGESLAETRPVFLEKAGVEEAPLFWAEELYQIDRIDGDWDGQKFSVVDPDGEQTTYTLGLAGHYQKQNLRTVLCAIEVLREDGWDIPPKAVARGLKKVAKNSLLRGRMERLQTEPNVIADTGHNEAGLQYVIEQIQNSTYQNLHIVWGMVSDKEHNKILAMLPKTAQYYFAKPKIDRGLDALTLQLKAEAFDLKGHIHESVQNAYQAALNAAGPEDLVYIGGSTFVVAEVLEAI